MVAVVELGMATQLLILLQYKLVGLQRGVRLEEVVVAMVKAQALMRLKLMELFGGGVRDTLED